MTIQEQIIDQTQSEAEADEIEEGHAAALLGLLRHLESKPPAEDVRTRAFRSAEIRALRYAVSDLMGIAVPPPKKAKARAAEPEIIVRGAVGAGSQVSQ
jgi:hypothetical protein